MCVSFCGCRRKLLLTQLTNTEIGKNGKEKVAAHDSPKPELLTQVRHLAKCKQQACPFPYLNTANFRLL